MNKYLQAAMMATALCSGAVPALAGETVSEARKVDARVVNVNLEGVINLTLKQGPVAALTLHGDKRQVEQVTLVQKGDTLIIDTETHRGTLHFDQRDLRAELTLPNLNELVSGGVGKAEVSGFNGANLRLALEGAGTVDVRSQYRNVNVKLGGVGSMTVNAGDSDNVTLDLRGAGRMEVSGQSKLLKVSLGGIGSLNAQQLRADAIDVSMTGLGSASVYAKNNATLTLSGLGSATVYGNPAKRSASTHGLGSINWQ